VSDLAADTVAVLACPELNGTRLRELAWQLEKTGTGLCVAPAVIDVAGPRTTIRPVAGMPLLHVDHPELTGFRWVIKGVFDWVSAAAALVVLAPLLGAIALAIRRGDGGPAIFRQTRVGGRARSGLQVPHHGGGRGAAQGRALAHNDGDGVLFKMRDGRDHPRGQVAAQVLPGRTAPTMERAQGGHVARRPPVLVPAEATLTATTCGAGSSSSRGSPVCAGQRKVGSSLGRGGPATCVTSKTGHSPWTANYRKTWAAVFKGSGAY
jgi:hypothetical protein